MGLGVVRGRESLTSAGAMWWPALRTDDAPLIALPIAADKASARRFAARERASVRGEPER